VRVIHCPFDDNYDVPLTASELTMVRNTAARVVFALRAGDRVYVSCHQGRNRSGLVVAHAVSYMTGCTGREAKQWVQARRPGSLQNPHFNQILEEVGRPVRPRRASVGA
jgi:protein-tyrosine phosphatase